jgi:hypothetical protein
VDDELQHKTLDTATKDPSELSDADQRYLRIQLGDMGLVEENESEGREQK